MASSFVSFWPSPVIISGRNSSKLLAESRHLCLAKNTLSVVNSSLREFRQILSRRQYVNSSPTFAASRETSREEVRAESRAKRRDIGFRGRTPTSDDERRARPKLVIISSPRETSASREETNRRHDKDRKTIFKTILRKSPRAEARQSPTLTFFKVAVKTSRLLQLTRRQLSPASREMRAVSRAEMDETRRQSIASRVTRRSATTSGLPLRA